METLGEKGFDCTIIPPSDADYLRDYLFEIGTSTDNPLTHLEIDAWMSNTGIVLTAWEARTLKRLSVDYMSSYAKSSDKKEPCPWVDAPYYLSPSAMVAMNLKQSMLELEAL